MRSFAMYVARTLLCLGLAVALQAQQPFSRSWRLTTTKNWAWQATDKRTEFQAGIIVSSFANSYMVAKGYRHPRLMASLATIAVSLSYEVIRWGAGKHPELLNGANAGLGSILGNGTIGFSYSIRFGNHRTTTTRWTATPMLPERLIFPDRPIAPPIPEMDVKMNFDEDDLLEWPSARMPNK